MPTLLQVRDRVDAWLEARWPTIVSRQKTYAANHGGRYWQGLWTNVDLPAHTQKSDGDAVPDNLGSRPADQSETWLDIFPELENVPIPAALWIDVYDGPLGQGFVGHVALKYKGAIYHQAQNYGPENWRTVAWEQITLDQIPGG